VIKFVRTGNQDTPALFSNDEAIGAEVAPTYIPHMFQAVKQGDCLLVKYEPYHTTEWFDQLCSMLFEECRNRGVALRFLAVNSDAEQQYEGLRIFWWKAPFDNPKSHRESLYFVNSEFLGLGDVGFNRLLATIRKEKPTQIAIIPSAVSIDGAYSGFEIAYEARKGELDEVLDEVKVKVVRVTLAPLRLDGK
jgi:hypothetical protein